MRIKAIFSLGKDSTIEAAHNQRKVVGVIEHSNIDKEIIVTVQSVVKGKELQNPQSAKTNEVNKSVTGEVVENASDKYNAGQYPILTSEQHTIIPNIETNMSPTLEKSSGESLPKSPNNENSHFGKIPSTSKEHSKVTTPFKASKSGSVPMEHQKRTVEHTNTLYSSTNERKLDLMNADRGEPNEKSEDANKQRQNISVTNDRELPASEVHRNLISKDHGTRHSDIPGDSMINTSDLKLELPENLDNDDFSKLFKLDGKNDHELFSTEDLLDHGIGPHQITSMSEETVNVEHKLCVSESRRGSASLTPDIQDTHKNVDNDSGGASTSNDSIISPKQPDTNATTYESSHRFDNSSVLLSNPGIAKSTTQDTNNFNYEQPMENTPASIIQEKNDLFYARRHNSLTPMMSQPTEMNCQETSKLESQDHQSEPNLGDESLKNKEPLHDNMLPAGQFIASATGASNISDEQSKISAYACLDFQNFTFYVQTLQVIIGRRSENDFTHKVDVNLGPSKSISRRHAKIFYNFGTERFELSIMGKNGAFVDDTFVERGITVPLKNKTKIQIGQIPFQFVLPDHGVKEKFSRPSKQKTESIAANTESTNNTVTAQGGRKDSIILPKNKDKKPAKAPKAPKKVYTLEEIPPEYRSKPTCSYSNLITTCLRKYSSSKGMSLSEIYASIRELFPYYKYCPDGWQSSVRHNLSLNKSFRKVSKEGKGWLWGLDEGYIAEREKQRKKQAEAQAAKLKAAELKQLQLQAKKQTTITNKSPTSASNGKQPNISQTLAANRSEKNNIQDDNQRTMKYLQQQLMMLTKNRRGLDKQVMAQILTQALAMTINQVAQAAKNKGISGNPLTALIDINPQHLNLILTAAINAATVKVTGGKVKKLVNMPLNSPIATSNSPPLIKKDSGRKPLAPSSKPPTPSIANPTSSSTLRPGEPFDPTSLSKFFQPKQPTRLSSAPLPSTMSSSVLPQKRSASDTESSDDDSVSSDEGSSDNDTGSSSDGSAPSSGDEEGHGSGNNSSSKNGDGGSYESGDDDDDDDDDGDESSTGSD
ncbi:Fhl1p Ecym_2615 [Eremothecium cymbalariae DBVPG|uniref:Pre-rRNA-processing protein FHL1 n=1 Tax=Eremothecium cymbalariae (strain CBS 270.75 / DBVPG 7215 / KCTC 17166 / NRRL Y-17582) TaxID=931890 RepID=G8JQJ5_ERECY|nr:Hypothetical protein Ecym_2615 [Eremothecium cymbalariae DBVPG\